MPFEQIWLLVVLLMFLVLLVILARRPQNEP
ncbi:MAG: hypothetical protein ACD_17C00508G0006 [uncultured bacterium]|nr:MAG: hypothetical protein ACD_17C00508G0006 [uncultured bacterium]